MESMKKLSIYLLLVFAGLTVTSCVDPISPQPEHNTGKYGINLSVICQSLETKATKHGEDQYNENLLSTVDWFIFTSDADESVLVKHGHEPKDTESGTLDQGTSEQLVTQAIKVNKDPIPMDDYIAASGMSGYIFLVANAPESITVTDGTTTLEDLRNLDVTANFGALTSGGKFQKQDNFVMTGGKGFTFTAQEPVLTRTVELSRIAAKVSLNVSVVPAIDEIITMPNGKKMYKQTWYPDLSNIQIYLSYADNHAVVAGTPDEFSSPGGSLFTYDRNAFTAKYSYTGYSGTDPVNPDAITPTWTNPDWEWNVTGSPFYSYPMKWKTTSPYSPFIKIILPWTAYKEPTTEVVDEETGEVIIKAERFKGADPEGQSEYKGKSNFYYKIPIPSANPEGEGDNKYLQLLQNEWYNLILDVAILGGTSDDLPLELAGQYFVVDWNNPDVQAGGVMKQGRYLSTATDTYYIYGGNSVEIPVQSSHDLAISNPNATYYDYSSATPSPATLSYSDDSASGNNFKIEADGRTRIILTHEMVSNMDDISGRDISTITYTFRIQHSDNPALYKDLKVIQFPSIYIETVTPGNAFLDGRSQGSSDSSYGYLSYDNKATTIYHIHVSAFNGDSRYYRINRNNGPDPLNPYEYIITDPRVKAGFENDEDYLLPYGPIGGAKTDWPIETVQNMKKGSPTRNFIAPSFIISSRYGRPGNSSADMTFETAQKRCATYQEAGYPAGRWRLPTEAEVFFVYTLQDKGLIADTFTAGGYGYWATSEYAFGRGSYIGFRKPSEYSQSGNTIAASVRCVYDTWYWGNDPVTPINEYHPGPTI